MNQPNFLRCLSIWLATVQKSLRISRSPLIYLRLAGYLLLLALALCPILARLIPWLRGGYFSITEDVFWFAFPRLWFADKSFSSNTSLQWFPNAGCGFSSLAEGQTGLCLPSTQIIYRLTEINTAFQIDVASGHLFAFLGMYFYLKLFNLTWISRIFASSFYAFCPCASIYYMPSMLWTYASLPLLFAGIRYSFLSNQKLLSFTAITVASSIIFLACHPPLVAYSGLLAATYLLFNITFANRFQSLRSLVIPTVATFTALIISLPQILPLLELYPFSARNILSNEMISSDDLYFHPAWLLCSFTPFVAKWFANDFFNECVRMPIFFLFLLPFGIYRASILRQYLSTGLLLSVLLISAGPLLPLWELIHSIPPLDNFRYPFRWLFFFPLFASPLVAFGVDFFLTSHE
jgi:hypothetical protein